MHLLVGIPKFNRFYAPFIKKQSYVVQTKESYLAQTIVVVNLYQSFELMLA